MSKNVFRANNNYNPKVKRNSVDLTFANNFTTKIGCITPVMRAYLNAGESLRFDCQHALQFLPTAFTVQSPVRVSVHHFAVRVRNLYKDFEDWRYKNKSDLRLPILKNTSKDMWGTGKLMDFLGAETSTYISNSISFDIAPQSGRYTHELIGSTNSALLLDAERYVSNLVSSRSYDEFYSRLVSRTTYSESTPSQFAAKYFVAFKPIFLRKGFNSYNDFALVASSTPLSSNFHYGLIVGYIPSSDNPSESLQILFQSEDVNAIQSYLQSITRPLYNGESWVDFHSNNLFFVPYAYNVSPSDPLSSWNEIFHYSAISNSSEICDSPYFASYLETMGFNALYPRAYESIYNFFYRSNQQVDPFIINGVVEPNKYTFTTDGGDDNNEYVLHFRNYEDDMFTTAKTTPIQGGKVPLVGITSNGLDSVLHFQRPDGTIAEIRSTLDDDGNVATINNEDLAKESQQVRLSAIEQVSQGVSIYDIRDASALTRWLEKNIRKGLRFADQQSAHTGVTPTYQELDMPEFIGGYSRVVSVGKVNDTANELGTYVGQLSSFSGSKHSVSYYADEPTIIMSVLCVIPQPVYSQVQDKFLTKLDALDFFDPDFNRLSMQPITYREITPWEKYLQDGNVDDVFGYQIPWYEDISCVDEAHGQMRTTFNSFLFTRNFNAVPKLGRNFLRINPEEMNKVFIYEEPDEDPIKGQIVFTRFKKTQVSKLNLPAIM